MSKSLGNVVDPVDLVDGLFSGNCDPLRYYLLRTGKMNSDSPFSRESLRDCYNNELVGNLGNLLSRVFKRLSLDEMSRVSQMTGECPDDEITGIAGLLCNDRINDLYYKFQYAQVADLAMEALSSANRYISAVEPWKFSKTDSYFHTAAQISRILKRVTSVLSPMIPESTARIDSILRAERGFPTASGGIFPRIS